MAKLEEEEQDGEMATETGTARNAPAVLLSGLPLVKPRVASRWFKGLFYGDPGTGKTVLCGSAEDVPEMQDILYVDAERGTLSIQDRGEHLDVMHMTSFDKDVESLIEFLRYENQGRYQTVVLDSLSSMFAMCMKDVEAALRRKSSSGAVDGRAVFGDTMKSIDLMVKLLYDMDINLLATCHEKEVKDDRTGEIQVKPALPGGLATQIARSFDVIGRLSIHAEFEKGGHNVTSVERRLMTNSHWKYLAKDRSGKLGTIVSEPTMQGLLDLIYA